MAVTRRDFLFASTLAVGGGMLASASAFVADGGAVRIGVISDTHVTGPESAQELERAFRFFAERGVDAVVHCGDITDLGYLSQLDVFISSWRRVMPPDTPLIAAFGNRDMSDTSKMTAAVKERDRSLLILSNPGAAMRRLCGWSAECGLRTRMVSAPLRSRPLRGAGTALQRIDL